MRFESDYAVTELTAHEGEWMVDHRLADLQLSAEGVLVLGIHRSDGSFVGAPVGATKIRPGDRVLAYGHTHALRELATRSAEAGDEAHAIAVDEHRAALRKLRDT